MRLNCWLFIVKASSLMTTGIIIVLANTGLMVVAGKYFLSISTLRILEMKILPCKSKITNKLMTFSNKSDYYFYGRVDKCHCVKDTFGYVTCNAPNKWNPLYNTKYSGFQILIWLDLYAPLSAWKQTSNIYSIWTPEWKPLNSFSFPYERLSFKLSATQRGFLVNFSIASSALQVRSAVRKRWHRWQDNHSLRMRVARAMSIPTSPTRISFHSIKQTTAVWAGEWVHNRHRIWEKGLNLSVKYEQPEWFVYTRPQRVLGGPSSWVRVALASKQPETHRHTG